MGFDPSIVSKLYTILSANTINVILTMRSTDHTYNSMRLSNTINLTLNMTSVRYMNYCIPRFKPFTTLNKCNGNELFVCHRHSCLEVISSYILGGTSTLSKSFSNTKIQHKNPTQNLNTKSDHKKLLQKISTKLFSAFGFNLIIFL